MTHCPNPATSERAKGTVSNLITPGPQTAPGAVSGQREYWVTRVLMIETEQYPIHHLKLEENTKSESLTEVKY